MPIRISRYVLRGKRRCSTVAKQKSHHSKAANLKESKRKQEKARA
jgi:hypothetical protein